MGCAPLLLPPDQLQSGPYLASSKHSLPANAAFSAQGKLGLKEGKRGSNVRFQWQQSEEQYSLALFSGFIGQGSIDISGDATQVILTEADGTKRQAKTPEALIEQTLNWSIPVSDLRYWLLGLPSPHTPIQSLQLDNEQRVWQLKQAGWTINYQSYRTLPDGTNVPYKLQLKNGSLSLKFVFTGWSRTN
jgi:outer membrane lipoprotein LolB